MWGGPVRSTEGGFVGGWKVVWTYCVVQVFVIERISTVVNVYYVLCFCFALSVSLGRISGEVDAWMRCLC